MKKTLTVLVFIALTLSLVAVAAAAAKSMSGTIKSVNISAGTISFCPAGTTKEQNLKVGHGLNIRSIKTGKAEIVVSNGMVTSVKPAAAAPPRRMIEGC
ncbi:MAG: hypothetical protein M0Z75_05550 [Nitrospiraceae bacterium]|nr:hypothetical protein [Nitrospiraceae bacterium]